MFKLHHLLLHNISSALFEGQRNQFVVNPNTGHMIWNTDEAMVARSAIVVDWWGKPDKTAWASPCSLGVIDSTTAAVCSRRDVCSHNGWINLPLFTCLHCQRRQRQRARRVLTCLPHATIAADSSAHSIPDVCFCLILFCLVPTSAIYLEFQHVDYFTIVEKQINPITILF